MGHMGPTLRPTFVTCSRGRRTSISRIRPQIVVHIDALEPRELGSCPVVLPDVLIGIVHLLQQRTSKLRSVLEDCFADALKNGGLYGMYALV